MLGPHVASWHRAEPHGLKITYWEDRFLFSYLMLWNWDLKKLKSPVAGFSFYGNLIPALTGDEISPSPAPPSTRDVPEGRAASVFVPHLTFLVTDALRGSAEVRPALGTAGSFLHAAQINYSFLRTLASSAMLTADSVL